MASIKRRGDHYQVTVSCGYNSRGKKLSETATFTPDPKKTERQNQKALQEFAFTFEQKVKNGQLMDGHRITLNEFAQRWLEDYVLPNLQPTSSNSYIQHLNDQIIPALGHMKMTEIKPHHLNRFYNQLVKNIHRKDGRPGGYSSATIHKIHTVLSSLMRTAMEWEVIDHNPCASVRLPSAPNTADNIKFFTPEQTVAFLNFLEEPLAWEVSAHDRVDDTGKPYHVEGYESQRAISFQMQVLFQLAIYSGMRRGEILALSWDNVDFEHNTVTVVRSLSCVKGKLYFKDPKTRSSIRTISLPASVMDKLSRHKEEQTRYRKLVEGYWIGDPYNLVFTRDNGAPMGISTPYQTLRKYIGFYNQRHPQDMLPLIPFHGLRHTSATLLIASHQDVRTVSSRLGHAQTSTTMNVYTHALRENDAIAAEALEEMLKGK